MYDQTMKVIQCVELLKGKKHRKTLTKMAVRLTLSKIILLK